eukprot:2541915-Prymnesium_polylepis.1
MAVDMQHDRMHDRARRASHAHCNRHLWFRKRSRRGFDPCAFLPPHLRFVKRRACVCVRACMRPALTTHARGDLAEKGCKRVHC